MELERGQLIEIVASITAVAGFVVALVVVSLLFNRTELSPTGGIVLVGVIALFILAMAGIGIYLARMEE